MAGCPSKLSKTRLEPPGCASTLSRRSKFPGAAAAHGSKFRDLGSVLNEESPLVAKRWHRSSFERAGIAGKLREDEFQIFASIIKRP